MARSGWPSGTAPNDGSFLLSIASASRVSIGGTKETGSSLLRTVGRFVPPREIRLRRNLQRYYNFFFSPRFRLPSRAIEARESSAPERHSLFQTERLLR